MTAPRFCRHSLNPIARVPRYGICEITNGIVQSDAKRHGRMTVPKYARRSTFRGREREFLFCRLHAVYGKSRRFPSTFPPDVKNIFRFRHRPRSGRSPSDFPDDFTKITSSKYRTCAVFDRWTMSRTWPCKTF